MVKNLGELRLDFGIGLKSKVSICIVLLRAQGMGHTEE